MAIIAVELEQALARRAINGGAGQAAGRLLAQGDGWSAEDVVCTSGPQDRPFEEQYGHVAIAVVAAGSFQYRSTTGRELMTPGSLLLGNAGQYFECGHDHGTGDRCLSFRYAPDYFENLASAAGALPDFRISRLPPLRVLSPLVARAFAGLAGSAGVAWDELSVEFATQAVQVANGLSPDRNGSPAGSEARVTRAVRMIDRHPDRELTLGSLAREAGLSPYHFLRIFERLTGVTPHQFLLRARLRQAAMRLAEPARVLDIALDCGFGDLSNFNRAFRAEFGVSPRTYRAQTGSAA